MKNNKFLNIIFILLAVYQFSFAQDGTLNNGRESTAQAGPVVETPATSTTSATEVGNDDFDVSRDQKEEPVDYFYPIDIDIMNDEMTNSIHPAELVQQINELSEMVEAMRLSYEELRLENRVIRESLTSCCSNSSMGLTARDAYLIQNAPNPFNDSAEIRYFVPSGLTNAEIQIANVKGEVLKTFNIEEAGYGQLSVNASKMANGSYIYMLSVDGEVIDSKVMIKTEND